MNLVKEHAARYFWPTQAGVAAPGGVEAGRMSVSHPTPKKVALQLDFKNAFNTVSRQHLLEQCLAHFPLLGKRPRGWDMGVKNLMPLHFCPTQSGKRLAKSETIQVTIKTADSDEIEHHDERSSAA